jgi:hypothetical protein
MMRVAGRARRCPAPERYLWIAVWHHLQARESADPATWLRYAKNQLRLAKDMAARPRHYAVKPSGKTDWQWSELDPA